MCSLHRYFCPKNFTNPLAYRIETRAFSLKNEIDMYGTMFLIRVISYMLFQNVVVYYFYVIFMLYSFDLNIPQQ